MSDRFQKKTSQIIVTILIGLIIVSFMFSGYISTKGSPDTIASVGGIPIKVKEYQMEQSRQLQLYKQLFGGKDLTAKQIKQFGIKQNTMNNLVNSKIMLLFADELSIRPGEREISDRIINYSYVDRKGATVYPFQSDGKFDLKLYKNLLAANRMTPNSFEKDIAMDLKKMKAGEILVNFPLSKKYLEDLYQFRQKKLNAQLISFPLKSLNKFIKVTQKEIDEYQKIPANVDRATALFKKRKSTLDRPAEVKARHILLVATPQNDKEVRSKIEKIAKKINVKNFAKMAKKYTEDPSGKNNGGDLGWIPKGRMVPEFDKMAFAQKVGTISAPVKTMFGYHIIHIEDKKEATTATFEKHKNKIITEMIQVTKTGETEKLALELQNKLKNFLLKGDIKSIKKEQKKYGLSYEENASLNRLDGNKDGKVNIKSDYLMEIFKNNKDIFVFNDKRDVLLAKVRKSSSKKDSEQDKKKAIEKDKKALSYALSRKLSQDVVETLKKDITIKTFMSVK